MSCTRSTSPRVGCTCFLPLRTAIRHTSPPGRLRSPRARPTSGAAAGRALERRDRGDAARGRGDDPHPRPQHLPQARRQLAPRAAHRALTGIAPPGGLTRARRSALRIRTGRLGCAAACGPGVGAVADRDVAGDPDSLGNLQQLPDLLFGGHQQGGECRAQAFSAQAEQDVLHERIDRGTTDDAGARQLPRR